MAPSAARAAAGEARPCCQWVGGGIRGGVLHTEGKAEQDCEGDLFVLKYQVLKFQRASEAKGAAAEGDSAKQSAGISGHCGGNQEESTSGEEAARARSTPRNTTHNLTQKAMSADPKEAARPAPAPAAAQQSPCPCLCPGPGPAPCRRRLGRARQQRMLRLHHDPHPWDCPSALPLQLPPPQTQQQSAVCEGGAAGSMAKRHTGAVV